MSWIDSTVMQSLVPVHSKRVLASFAPVKLETWLVIILIIQTVVLPNLRHDIIFKAMPVLSARDGHSPLVMIKFRTTVNTFCS